MRKLKIVLVIFIFTIMLMGCTMASKSENIYIDKTYHMDAVGMPTVIFTADGKYVWSEKGTYEFATTDTESNVIKIFWDVPGEGDPGETDYKIEKKEEEYNLTAVYTTADGEEVVTTAANQLYFTEGTDGLQNKEMFDGIYNINSKDDRGQYIFYEDGMLELVAKSTYKMTANIITIGTTDYTYEMSEDKKTLKIKNKGGDLVFDLYE